MTNERNNPTATEEMSDGVEGITLTEEEREVTEWMAETDFPLASVAQGLLYLDELADESSNESTTIDSKRRLK